MEVTFYSGFAKRINSTKRPTGGTVIDVQIKDKCDLHAPVLKIAGEAGQYNYFKIGETYYFVNGETVMPSGWVEISGIPDAMGTCADDVKSTKAFVIRSAQGSTDLVDELAPPKTRGTISAQSEQTLFPISNTGTFIVSLANMPYPVSMTQSQMISLYNKLNSKDATQQVENQYSDLLGTVRGCVWTPYAIPTVGTLQIKAGDYDTGVTASYISQEITTKSASFSLDLDSTSLSSSNYKSLHIFLPFCGATTLSIDDFRTSGVLNVLADFDNFSGDISYFISDGVHLNPVASFHGKSAVPFAIGSTSYGLNSLAPTSLAASIAYALSGGGISAFFKASHSGTQMAGSGYRTKLQSVVIGVIEHEPPEALTSKNSVAGLPDMRTRTLGSVSGYVQCRNASIESHHESDLIQQCNNYLNQGAYIE